MAGSVFFNANVAIDLNGDTAAGAKAYFYQTGTTTPVTVYSDSALTTPHATPLVADSNGRFATVYTSGSVQLKVTVTDADDATLPGYPVDPAIIESSSAAASSVAFTPTASISSTNVQAAIEEVDATAQAASTASEHSVRVDTGYVAPLYPVSLTDLDAAVRTGFFTLSGTYDSTPTGDSVAITGMIEIVKRYYTAGATIMQRLSLSGTESEIWTRTGTGAGPTFGPWVRQIDTGQVSSSAENIAGTSTAKYPNVAGVKEMIDTHALTSAGWEYVEDTYDFAVDGAVGSVESAAFADGYEYAFDINNLSNGSGGGELYMQFYRETDAAYTTSATLYTMGGIGDESIGWVELKNSRLSTKVKSAIGSAHYASSLSLDTGYGGTVSATAFARLTTAQKVGKVKFLSPGTFDSGVIAMYRRQIT